ncbi:MAG: class I SAM-dependent methyltransferase [Oligoflexales bacterium]|nr:class I SAM-dependent methyltransferase [Oligoflexales bacterium]
MSNIFDIIFVREKHVCPWWCCFTFDNFFRKFFQDPYKIVSPYIKPGDNVLDVGPGQGYFTLPMARMVGPQGKIIAVDIQKRMLAILEKRAKKKSLEGQIHFQLVSNENFKIEYPLDFALAFWMVHEVSDREVFLKSILNALKPNATLLIAEPKIHVTGKNLDDTIAIAKKMGYRELARPPIAFSRAVLLVK